MKLGEVVVTHVYYNFTKGAFTNYVNRVGGGEGLKISKNCSRYKSKFVFT